LKDIIQKEIERLKRYQEQLQREIIGVAYQIAELEKLLDKAEKKQDKKVAKS